MVQELDLVVLTRDITSHALKRGDTGVVVHRYADGTAFEVEFVTADGRTVGVLTLATDDLRPLDGQEILHVREYTHAAAPMGG